MSFKRPIIQLHIQYNYIYTWRNSPYFSFPSLALLCSPFVSPSTYLAPSSCDRNRPPQSQVACKLTPFAPPLTQPTPPLQIPRTPTAQRLTKMTSGIFRLLLTGTTSTFFRTANSFYIFALRSYWDSTKYFWKLLLKQHFWQILLKAASTVVLDCLKDSSTHIDRSIKAGKKFLKKSVKSLQRQQLSETCIYGKAAFWNFFWQWNPLNQYTAFRSFHRSNLKTNFKISPELLNKKVQNKKRSYRKY